MTHEQYLALGYIQLNLVFSDTNMLLMLVKFEQHYFSMAWAHSDYKNQDGDSFVDWVEVFQIYPELAALSDYHNCAALSFPYSRLQPFFVPDSYDSDDVQVGLIKDSQNQQIQDELPAITHSEQQRLSIDDETMTKAVTGYLALAIRADSSMTINSYFEVWGLGKTDLTDYSLYYQDFIQCYRQSSLLKEAR